MNSQAYVGIFAYTHLEGTASAAHKTGAQRHFRFDAIDKYFQRICRGTQLNATHECASLVIAAAAKLLKS